MDRLPQTLQHGDPSGRNLFWSESLQAANGETVAIDWSWLNVSAVGFDLDLVFFASRLGSATDATNSIILAPEAEREAPISRDPGDLRRRHARRRLAGETALVRLGYLLSTAEQVPGPPVDAGLPGRGRARPG